MDEPATEPNEGRTEGERERLLAEKQTFEARLLNGEQMIREAREQRDIAKAARLERHWLGLLREYEAICARLDELDPSS